jgi:hypothetical protein
MIIVCAVDLLLFQLAHVGLLKAIVDQIHIFVRHSDTKQSRPFSKQRLYERIGRDLFIHKTLYDVPAWGTRKNMPDIPLAEKACREADNLRMAPLTNFACFRLLRGLQSPRWAFRKPRKKITADGIFTSLGAVTARSTPVSPETFSGECGRTTAARLRATRGHAFLLPLFIRRSVAVTQARSGRNMQSSSCRGRKRKNT